MTLGQNNKTADTFGGLSAVDTAAKAAARLPAGPFNVSPERSENSPMTLPDALITGLLVVYPVVATVVAVIVGLALSGRVA
jgi:hypothetical protein